MKVDRHSFAAEGAHCPFHGAYLRACSVCDLAWCKLCDRDDCPQCGGMASRAQSPGYANTRREIEVRDDDIV